MRLAEIERKARGLGIKETWRYSKRELIKAIQRTEGNFECFSNESKGNCSQLTCCWREDCFK